MAISGDVFRINQVYELLQEDKWPLDYSLGKNYAWFGGGIDNVSGNPTNKVDKISFSTDTNVASSRGTLLAPRSSLGATSNANYGWFGGGFGPAARTNIYRIDFRNDSVTASFRGNLLGTGRSTATGNNNYGWFAGSQDNSSTVDRITFAEDTSAASARGPLSLGRRLLAATDNNNFGWFGGGTVFPTTYSTVDRIDFAADTGTASVRGPLSLGRRNLAVTGNNNFGWFGGGDPDIVSTVDRIDFAADTGTASIRGPLSLRRSNLAASGNDDYGWFTSGLTFPSPQVSQFTSITDRITFNNDTVTASVRGSLTTEVRYNHAGVAGPLE